MPHFAECSKHCQPDALPTRAGGLCFTCIAEVPRTVTSGGLERPCRGTGCQDCLGIHRFHCIHGLVSTCYRSNIWSRSHMGPVVHVWTEIRWSEVFCLESSALSWSDHHLLRFGLCTTVALHGVDGPIRMVWSQALMGPVHYQNAFEGLSSWSGWLICQSSSLPLVFRGDPGSRHNCS